MRKPYRKRQVLSLGLMLSLAGQPWQALRQYNRVKRTLSEDICSDRNINPFGIDYGTPVAEKPDF
jgi:hypothetical protein